MKERRQYHIVRKNRADVRALLRGAVSGYLLCLAYQMAFASGADSAFSPVVGIVVSILFAVCAVAFGVYTWKHYQTDCRNALLTSEELDTLNCERDANDAGGI